MTAVLHIPTAGLREWDFLNMANYDHTYQPEASESDPEQVYRTLPDQMPMLAAASTVPSNAPARQMSVTSQPYQMAYYGSPQQHAQYQFSAPMAPSPQSYSSYSQPSSASTASYAYYQQHYPDYTTMHAQQQLPLPEFNSATYQAPSHHTTPQPRSVVSYASASESPHMGRAASRSISLAPSVASSMQYDHTDHYSRSVSPSGPEMSNYGYRNESGSWSCSYPGCTSKSTFQRGCDLRKHYRRHTKTLFCRHPGCPQATDGGFSSKKDRARHEAKHDPQITCEWPGCNRLFSRMDNMKDHVRRIHKKEAGSAS